MLNSYQLENQNKTCYLISHNFERFLLVSVFILGFIIMKFFVFKETEATRIEKEKKAQLIHEYLEKHKSENEEFFFQATVSK